MINERQKQFFRNNGYLHIPNVFPKATMFFYTDKVENALSSNHFNEDILLNNGYPQKLLYMFNKDPSFLKLLVSQPILEILSNFSEDYSQTVPTWEDCVIKPPFTNTGFKPHQDLPLQSLNSPVFTLAIYFTDSIQTPVSFLSGTHHLGPLSRKQLNEVCHNKKNEFIEVEAKQGDIIIHNAKTIHQSSNNTTPNPKYTWYLEFRTKNQLINDSLWDIEWCLRRRAIFVSALERYQPELIPTWAKDYSQLSDYLSKLELKVPHVTSDVDFDMESPYYHF